MASQSSGMSFIKLCRESTLNVCAHTNGEIYVRQTNILIYETECTPTSASFPFINPTSTRNYPNMNLSHIPNKSSEWKLVAAVVNVISSTQKTIPEHFVVKFPCLQNVHTHGSEFPYSCTHSLAKFFSLNPIFALQEAYAH